MKRAVLMAVVLLFMFALGAQAADLKIGYVDLNKALNESDAGKKAVKTLEEIFKTKQAVIDEKQKEIRKLDEELAKQTSILNPDALKGKREDFERLKRDFQRMIKDSEEEVEKKRADFMDRIIKELSETIRKTGEEEGYAVILEKNEAGLIYSSEKLDLTDKIVKKYNEASKAEKKSDK
jgi:outer membrane protein